MQAYSPLLQMKKEAIEHPDLVKIAKTHNKSPAQVLIRWSLQQG